MQHKHRLKKLAGLAVLAAFPVISSSAFEGYIHANTSRGGPSMGLVYTVGTNGMRVEMTDTNWSNPVNLVDRGSGTVTLLFPQNRCLVRLTPSAENTAAPPPGMPPGMDRHFGNAPGGVPGMPIPPQMPGGSGMPAPPQVPGPPAGMPGGLPPSIGPTNFPGMTGSRPQMPPMPQRPQMPQAPVMSGNAGMPAMPMMPIMGENLELKATGMTTNLLGYDCRGFEIQQREDTMTVWATDQLPPFQVYLPAEPHRFGPPMVQEQWGNLLTAKNLFPLLASLRAPNGVERYRFEVESIQPALLSTNDYKRLQPPADYVALQPHPF